MKFFTYVNDGPNSMWDFTPGDQIDAAGAFEVEADSPEEGLELLWAVGNRMAADMNGKTWSKDIRSMCVGDIAIAEGTDGALEFIGLVPFVVDHVGWRLLGPTETLDTLATLGRPHECRAVRQPVE